MLLVPPCAASSPPAPSVPPRPTGPTASQPAHRHDIQVLRALAVVLVVLYHLNVPGFDAGYIGVDIFFVISGYLITRLLLVELDSTGTVDLGRFLARRIRRLLPMSFLVLGATLLLVRSRSSQLQQLEEVGIAEAAATYRANLALADRGTDYLASGEASALQHYWSLAVEEQFYVLLPLALLVLARIVGRAGTRRAAVGLMAIVGAGSFLWAIGTTSASPTEAYFLLQYRAWEFLAGGLLAARELCGRQPASGRAWRTAGSVGIVAAMAVTPHLAFPGPGALPAVGATVALVWSGVAASATDAAGAGWSAARWIGDRSYSIYLWHWPPIVVFGLDETPATDRLPMRLAVIVLTLIASAVTYRLVETPLRNTRVLRSSPRAVGLLAIVSVVGFLMAGPMLRPGIAAVFGPPTETLDGRTLAEGPPPTPDRVPENIRPGLREANAAAPLLGDDGCHAALTAREPGAIADCTFGGSGASGTIALVGDSHAAQWFDGLEASATDLDADLTVVTKSGCAVTGLADARSVADCEAWRANALDHLVAVQPDIVVVANVARTPEREDPAELVEAISGGLDDIAAVVPDATIVYLLDLPPAPHDVPSCLADGGKPRRCAVPTDPGFDEIQRAAVGDRADLVVEPASWLCNDDRCAPFIGDVLVYRDTNHLSRPAALMLEPLLTEVLIEAGLR